MAKKKEREEARRLRSEQRLGLEEIASAVGVSKSTVSGWLRDLPLSVDEVREKHASAMARRAARRREEEATRRPSLLHQMATDAELTRAQRGKLAEAAVLVRLLAAGLEVYGSVFDGDKFDWVCRNGSSLLRVQVKLVLPDRTVSLKCSAGRAGTRRYLAGEFDILVGYDLFEDACYVWTEDELARHASCIAPGPGALERWDKVR